MLRCFENLENSKEIVAKCNEIYIAEKKNYQITIAIIIKTKETIIVNNREERLICLEMKNHVLTDSEDLDLMVKIFDIFKQNKNESHQ